MTDELHLNDYTGQETHKNKRGTLKEIIKEWLWCFIFSLIISIFLSFLCWIWNISSQESLVCAWQELTAMIIMGIMMPLMFILLIIPIIVFWLLIYKTKENISKKWVRIFIISCLYILFHLLVSIYRGSILHAMMSL